MLSFCWKINVLPNEKTKEQFCFIDDVHEINGFLFLQVLSVKKSHLSSHHNIRSSAYHSDYVRISFSLFDKRERNVVNVSHYKKIVYDVLLYSIIELLFYTV